MCCSEINVFYFIMLAQSGKMVSDMRAHIKQMYVIEFLYAEKIAHNDIILYLLNIFKTKQ